MICKTDCKACGGFGEFRGTMCRRCMGMGWERKHGANETCWECRPPSWVKPEVKESESEDERKEAV